MHKILNRKADKFGFLGVNRLVAIALAVCILITGTSLVAESAFAQDAKKGFGIVAVVGDSVVSNIDLDERIKIAIFASNLPKSQELIDKLLPQILRNLIDERIYMAESGKLGIEVTPDEIKRVVADIEQRNKIPSGKFNEFLQHNGISPDSMMQQITAQLTWSKIIAKKLRPQVVVTSQEVDEKYQTLAKAVVEDEYNLSEILLTFDSEAEAEKTRAAGNKIVSELRKNADFRRVAVEFSKAANASEGGNLGWVKVGQLDPAVALVVQNLKNGEVSDPVKTDDGYVIVKLSAKRGPNDSGILKDKVRENMIMRKLELKAAKYQRDLRSSAYIEIRL